MRNTQHISVEKREFSRKLEKTKEFLKTNQSVFITKVDKGNVTVCLNKFDYIKKMEQLLSDRNSYNVVKKNPLKRLQRDSSNI